MLGMNPLDNWTPFSTTLFLMLFIIGLFFVPYWLARLSNRKPEKKC